MQPPVARREPHPTNIHGKTLEDDYFWLRNKDSEEVIEYLKAENAYTHAFMEPTKELQDRLYREMLSHIKETDVSVPYLANGYFYYTRTVEGLQYPIYCRKPSPVPGDPNAVYNDDAAEQVILDVNELAKDQPFMAIGGLAVSSDNTLLAYSTDNTGFRQYTLHIRSLVTGEDLADTAPRTGSLVWADDSKTLFYTLEDEQTKRHYRLYRHTLGEDTAKDVVIFEETDERFNLGAGRSRDRKYIFIESGSHTTTEVRFAPASDPATFTLLAPRINDQEYYADHRNGRFYIRVNDTGKNFRLVSADVNAPGREHWVEELPEDAEYPLEDFDLFRDFAVASDRVLGLPRLRVFGWSGEKLTSASEEVTFPEPTYSAGLHVNAEFAAATFRYSYQSLVSPSSVYSYDVNTHSSTLLKQQEVPGGFDRSRYASERIWATASDGTKIPVSLVYRRDEFVRNGENPLYVYGYGSYGYALPVGFNPNRLSLLDRGLVLAYAHIRGGGDLGDKWHDAGKMQVKMNTFSDFIAATEHLVAEGYSDPKRVAIEGGSAGGLLMGAVTNLRPDLFSVVLSHVPFVDVMNTMLDDSLPLTVGEYEEWGNPNEPEAFATMHAYSPYDNLKPGDYPAMLVKTSLNDSQVMYWEPAKYIAKLRTLKNNGTPLLLETNMDAGHGGASGRYDYLKEIAFDYAFLLTQLGVEKSQ